jgi:hypothetical protein
MKEELKLNP